MTSIGHLRSFPIAKHRPLMLHAFFSWRAAALLDFDFLTHLSILHAWNFSGSACGEGGPSALPFAQQLCCVLLQCERNFCTHAPACVWLIFNLLNSLSLCCCRGIPTVANEKWTFKQKTLYACTWECAVFCACDLSVDIIPRACIVLIKVCARLSLETVYYFPMSTVGIFWWHEKISKNKIVLWVKTLQF
jgi:hypothetical protein